MKLMVKGALLRSGGLRLAASLRRRGVVILRYHSVLEDPAQLNDVIGCGIVHSAEAFEQHMRLVASSFLPVTMDDLLEYAGGKPVPPRAVAVTFDDGFADNAEVAAPIMEKYGVRATFYVTTGSIAPRRVPWFITLRRAFQLTGELSFRNPVDGKLYPLATQQERWLALLEACAQCGVLDQEGQGALLARFEELLGVAPHAMPRPLMMGPAQIRELHSRGHLVGSHTVSHPNLAHMSPEQVPVELRASKAELEEILGAPVHHFSYPSPVLEPHYNGATVAASREAGYRTAVTCTHGVFHGDDDLLACRRIFVPEAQDQFRWSLESAFAGLGP